MKADELFEKVTADLVAAIEDGARGWQMPWHRLGAAGTPRSVDGRPYRGWNALVLGMTAAEYGWCGVWATYRAWARHGAQVRRGERGTQVVLWKPTEHHTANSDAAGDDSDHSVLRRSLFARTFTVFAAEQVDGAEAFTVPPAASVPADRVAAAEAYFAAVAARVVSGGDRACYVQATDTIYLPALAQFERASDLYSTSAHEHVHRTGHETRLARDLSGRFGDHAYGAEELVAELGAAFWCAQFRLDQVTRHDHAAYIGDWLALLRADARALVSACGHAQRAIDHLNTAAGWQPTSAAEQEPATR